MKIELDSSLNRLINTQEYSMAIFKLRKRDYDTFYAGTSIYDSSDPVQIDKGSTFEPSALSKEFMDYLGSMGWSPFNYSFDESQDVLTSAEGLIDAIAAGGFTVGWLVPKFICKNKRINFIKTKDNISNKLFDPDQVVTYNVKLSDFDIETDSNYTTEAKHIFLSRTLSSLTAESDLDKERLKALVTSGAAIEYNLMSPGGYLIVAGGLSFGTFERAIAATVAGNNRIQLTWVLSIDGQVRLHYKFLNGYVLVEAQATPINIITDYLSKTYAYSRTELKSYTEKLEIGATEFKMKMTTGILPSAVLQNIADPQADYGFIIYESGAISPSGYKYTDAKEQFDSLFTTLPSGQRILNTSKVVDYGFLEGFKPLITGNKAMSLNWAGRRVKLSTEPFLFTKLKKGTLALTPDIYTPANWTLLGGGGGGTLTNPTATSIEINSAVGIYSEWRYIPTFGASGFVAGRSYVFSFVAQVVDSILEYVTVFPDAVCRVSVTNSNITNPITGTPPLFVGTKQFYSFKFKFGSAVSSTALNFIFYTHAIIVISEFNFTEVED